MDGSSVTREAHHTAPRCLISLHERANNGASLDGEGIQAWLCLYTEKCVEGLFSEVGMEDAA
jgi:hypothetical protein